MRTFAGVLLPLLVAGLTLLAPAAYAGEQLVLSADGLTWSSSLAAPLFDPAERWVPGDERTVSFYAGNRAAGAGELSVRATAEDADGLVARDDLDLEVRKGSGVWTALPADDRLHPLVDGLLASGGQARVWVRARFHPSSPNTSQLRSLPLRFEVVLTQVGSEVAPPGSGGHGLLPATGGIDRRVLAVGLALVVLGTSTLLAARRKDRHEAA